MPQLSEDTALLANDSVRSWLKGSGASQQFACNKLSEKKYGGNQQ